MEEKGEIKVVPINVNGEIRELHRNFKGMIKNLFIGRFVSDIHISPITQVVNGKDCITLQMSYSPEKFYLEPMLQKIADKVEAKKPDSTISAFELEITETLFRIRKAIDNGVAHIMVSLPVDSVRDHHSDPKYIANLVGHAVSRLVSMSRKEH